MKMKKAKHKRSKNKNVQKSFWNKRSFFIATGLAALLSGTALFYFNKQEQVVINSKPNDDEVRRSLIPVNEAHDVELSQNEELDFKMGLMNSQRVSLDDIVVEKANEHSWIIPFDNPKDFTQSQEELTNYIDELFQFVNHSKIVKPKINIVVPRKGDVIIDLTEGDAVQIYVVKLTGDKLTVYYRITTKNQTISGDSNKLFYNEGHTGSFYSYSFDEKRIVYLEQKRGNIFYSPRTDLDKVETVPIECLHRAFAPWTAANIHRHINGYYEDHDASKDMVPWIINRNTEIEEGLVHAIAYLWLQQNLDKFPGIKQQDLEISREHYKVDERYKMVEFALEVIEKNGLEKAIDMYTTGQLSLNVR